MFGIGPIRGGIRATSAFASAEPDDSLRELARSPMVRQNPSQCIVARAASEVASIISCNSGRSPGLHCAMNLMTRALSRSFFDRARRRAARVSAG